MVKMCLKGHTHLVYDIGQSGFGCHNGFSAYNIESLTFVLSYVVSYNDHEVLKLVPECDDN